MSLNPPGALWFAISCPSRSIKNDILHMTCNPPKIFHPSCEKNENPPLLIQELLLADLAKTQHTRDDEELILAQTLTNIHNELYCNSNEFPNLFYSL